MVSKVSRMGVMLTIGSSLMGLSGTMFGSSKHMSMGVFGENGSGECKLWKEPRYAGDLRCEYFGDLSTSNRTLLACPSAARVGRERPMSRDALVIVVALAGECLAVL